MRIAQARFYRQLQPFIDGPYWCRGQTEDGFDSTIVALVAEDGTTGWGEVAPLGAFYSDGFPEGVRAGVTHLLPGTVGQPATVPARLKERMDQAMWGQPMAKSAIDMAAWDLAARLAGLPLSTLLGGAEGNAADLYRSVGQAAPGEMSARAAGYLGAGYRHLQVKVGGDPLEDADRLRAIRAQIGEDVPLWADANGAWDVDEASRFVAATRDLDYRLEQPCMDHDANVQVSRDAGRPLVLDEAIENVPDLLRAWRAGIVSGVTLKIARLGGVTETRLVRDLAVTLGLKVTVEDTGGSTIATAAIAQMMMSMPAASRCHTLDLMNWTSVQNADDMPPVVGGSLIVPDGPGLGVTVSEASLGEPLAVFS